MSGTASQSGTQYANFNAKLLAPLVAQPNVAVSDYSERIPGVVLTQGAAGSGGLAATEGEGLDIVITTHTAVDSYDIPALQYFQQKVPYTIVPTSNGIANGQDLTTFFTTQGGMVCPGSTAIVPAAVVVPAASGLSVPSCKLVSLYIGSVSLTDVLYSKVG